MSHSGEDEVCSQVCHEVPSTDTGYREEASKPSVPHCSPFLPPTPHVIASVHQENLSFSLPFEMGWRSRGILRRNHGGLQRPLQSPRQATNELQRSVPGASGLKAESEPPGAGPASSHMGWRSRRKTTLPCRNPQSSSCGSSSVTSASPLAVLHLGAAINRGWAESTGWGPGGAGSGSQVPCLAASGGKGGWKRVFSLFLLSSFPAVPSTHLMSSDQSINLVCSLCSVPAATFSLV